MNANVTTAAVAVLPESIEKNKRDHFLAPSPTGPKIGGKCTIIGTRSSADADNLRDALRVSRGQQTWYHFGSVATFR